MRYITALIIGLTIWVIGLAPVWGEEIDSPEFPFATMQDVGNQVDSEPFVMQCAEGVLLLGYHVGEAWAVFSDHETKFVAAYYLAKKRYPDYIYYGKIEKGQLNISIIMPFVPGKHTTPCQWWAEVPA